MSYEHNKSDREHKEQNRCYLYWQQVDYGEDTSDTQTEIDKYEDVLIETDTHILARCESKNFGWLGDTFFLYRKDKKK